MRMTGLLLRKEFRLAVHPTSLLFLGLSAMLMIPNYPYLVVFFYTALGIFFTCLTGRENQDVMYTMLLPVSKRDVIRARILLAVLLEAAQTLCCIPFVALRRWLMPAPNLAGMDANVALLGFGLAVIGVFNRSFFRVYCRNVKYVGRAFVAGSTAVFLCICAVEISAHTVPWVRDVLDTPDPQHMPDKVCVLVLGAALWMIMTALTWHRGAKDFAMQDL